MYVYADVVLYNIELEGDIKVKEIFFMMNSYAFIEMACRNDAWGYL